MPRRYTNDVRPRKRRMTLARRLAHATFGAIAHGVDPILLREILLGWNGGDMEDVVDALYAATDAAVDLYGVLAAPEGDMPADSGEPF